MMTRTVCLSLVAASALLGAACGKGGGGGKTATVDLFGKKPVPPGDLAKIKADMTQAQVKAALPTMKPTPNHSGSPDFTIDSGYSNAEYRIGFYSDKDAVADVTVEVPPDVAKKLESAWGKPADMAGGGSKWVNDDDGYEVEVMDMGRRTLVAFHPFIPLTAAYFGSKPGPFDVLTKVKLGMSRDEIAKAAPGFETAGPPKGGGSYMMYDGTPKDVQFSLEYDDSDKVRVFHVDLQPDGAQKLTKAWGEHPGKARGTGTPMQCWDLADGTRIELEDTRVTFTTPANSVCEI